MKPYYNLSNTTFKRQLSSIKASTFEAFPMNRSPDAINRNKLYWSRNIMNANYLPRTQPLSCHIPVLEGASTCVYMGMPHRHSIKFRFLYSKMNKLII